MSNVAVIISAYNVQDYINESIQSALDQKYENKRIYVYNDGSTDKTLETAKQLELDGVFILGEDANKGLSYGRNRLIQEAWDWADYFLILDGDDKFCDPDKIEKMVKVFQSAPKIIGVVYTDYQNYYQVDGKMVREYKRGFSRYMLIKECILSDSGTMVAKTAYEKVGKYDEELRVGMDYDMWLRISEHMLIYHIPECTTTVRMRSNSLSSDPQNKDLWRKNIGRVYEKLSQRNS